MGSSWESRSSFCSLLVQLLFAFSRRICQSQHVCTILSKSSPTLSSSARWGWASGSPSASNSRTFVIPPNPVTSLSPPFSSIAHFIDQVFGISIIGALLGQGFLGYYHHRRFVRDKPSHRRWFTHAHIWLGRVLIVCGLINCGFGLQQATFEWRYSIIWWSICAFLVGVYFVGVVVRAVLERRRRSRRIGEPFGTATGPELSLGRYSRADSYEMTNSSK